MKKKETKEKVKMLKYMNEWEIEIMADNIADDFYTIAPKYRTRKKIGDIILNFIRQLQDEKI